MLLHDPCNVGGYIQQVTSYKFNFINFFCIVKLSKLLSVQINNEFVKMKLQNTAKETLLFHLFFQETSVAHLGLKSFFVDRIATLNTAVNKE